ncbi:fimbrial protein [Litchfieldella qijiaojingensis]|uniref:Fimbrial protein n=1 Tax=Litchfieldella qijiaojingensis TaxID=980347 RepID=A0ABQ2YZM0_9GAMM|nr:pilus assembly protein PilP [Halomonas qijiaojingensis]GGX97272.1 fimbrial protein [Halomonas qijiaojingensis]
MMSRWILVLAMVVLLVACVDPELERLDRELATLRVDPREVDLPALPELPSSADATYDHADTRSPFLARQPDAEEALAGSSELAPNLSRPKEPLEAYVLESLELVGTLVVGGRHSALVRAPDGQVHRLATGSYLGTDFGRIVDIDGDSVLLIEVIATGQGGWVERSRYLTLDGESSRRN